MVDPSLLHQAALGARALPAGFLPWLRRKHKHNCRCGELEPRVGENSAKINECHAKVSEIFGLMTAAVESAGIELPLSDRPTAPLPHLRVCRNEEAAG